MVNSVTETFVVGRLGKMGDLGRLEAYDGDINWKMGYFSKWETSEDVGLGKMEDFGRLDS